MASLRIFPHFALLLLGAAAIAVALSSCGGMPCVDNGGFQSYLDSFSMEGATRGKSVDICGVKVSEVERLENGQMAGGESDPLMREIRIRQGYWERLSSPGKELAMFHELGIVALGRKDDDFGDLSLNQDREPRSIMADNLGLFSPSYYWDHRKQYLDELFGVGHAL
jgi:hypothetical protein